LYQSCTPCRAPRYRLPLRFPLHIMLKRRWIQGRPLQFVTFPPYAFNLACHRTDHVDGHFMQLRRFKRHHVTRFKFHSSSPLSLLAFDCQPNRVGTPGEEQKRTYGIKSPLHGSSRGLYPKLDIASQLPTSRPTPK